MGLKLTISQGQKEGLWKLKSDHFGIEIKQYVRQSFRELLLKSDHFGIEIKPCLYVINQDYELKSDHFGIEIMKMWES